ncbi:hypothetical protein C8F04DRAFT_1184880 [Mycena alexandri]|uniref:Uncharacterized protein n=1 Tax=Mycena alexandri TaxID=1745969 RepID=A0AAD6SUM1_9AGAR|nr:hypothetical protein C8F04DRAFT_1184880 [Mycena alexandri]
MCRTRATNVPPSPGWIIKDPRSIFDGCSCLGLLFFTSMSPRKLKPIKLDDMLICYRLSGFSSSTGKRGRSRRLCEPHERKGGSGPGETKAVVDAVKEYEWTAFDVTTVGRTLMQYRKGMLAADKPVCDSLLSTLSAKRRLTDEDVIEARRVVTGDAVRPSKTSMFVLIPPAPYALPRRLAAKVERNRPGAVTNSALESDLRLEIYAIGDDANLLGAWLPQLDTFAGPQINVYNRAIMYTDGHDKLNFARWVSGLNDFGTMSDFVHPKIRGGEGAKITLGLVIFRALPRAGRSAAAWSTQAWHSNILVNISSDTRGCKSLLICDPNVINNVENPVKGKMAGMLKVKRTPTNRWINNVRSERNSDGICLTLCLEWMMEIVTAGVDGLEIEKDAAGLVTGVKGFRLLM